MILNDIIITPDREVCLIRGGLKEMKGYRLPGRDRPVARCDVGRRVGTVLASDRGLRGIVRRTDRTKP